MTQNISPGVYTIEKDLSQYVSDLSQTIVAMVGTAEKGPSNKPTLVTSASQFVDLFGKQNPKHYLGYAALAYLEKGSSLYVTRVAAPDAVKASVATILPKGSKAFSGEWSLVSNTTSEAVFAVKDFSTLAAKSPEKTITLDDGTVIPGFDFTDSTGTVPANGKLGSDLSSFVGKADFISKYIKGSTFTVSTGAGKGSSVSITGLDADAGGLPLIKVASSKFSAFNSPITATAVGQISFGSSISPADGDVVAVIGKTNLGKSFEGNISLVYSTVGTSFDTDTKKAALVTTLTGSNDANKLAALDQLVNVIESDQVVSVNVSLPLYLADAAANCTLVNAILTALVTVLRTKSSSDLTSYTNVSAVYLNARAQSDSGLVGLGSIDASGNSSGVKATELVVNAANVATAVKLFAIAPGAAGVKPLTGSTVATVVSQEISGTFTTDLFRPTWDLSEAGSAFVPTILKFTSIGEGDFSNIAITLNFDISKTLNSEQIYSIRVYSRLTSDTVLSSSVAASDFTLVESFEGTLDTLRSNINASSKVIQLKVDYSSQDSISLVTGGIVKGSSTDNLAFDPILTTDITGKGVLLGTTSSANSSFGFILSGGSAGSDITVDNIIGDSGSKTGLYSFADPEQFDINLLLAPGWSADPSVAKAAVDICEDRADCMAILDTPFALNVQGAVNYRRNIQNINSNYGALYYPWISIQDSVNKKTIFVPPSGYVAAQYAYSDQVGDVYSAPAGRNRGNITNALATERVLNQGDRDILAVNQINPIHSESGYGTYIRGQMTLQSSTTALDRVNVRRLLLKLRKVVATASKYFEFEPGDSITALRLKQIADTILDEHQRKGAIRSYTIDVGPAVNTALVLENNELRMSISIVPTKTAERITEVFNILPQGQGISIS